MKMNSEEFMNKVIVTQWKHDDLFDEKTIREITGMDSYTEKDLIRQLMTSDYAEHEIYDIFVKIIAKIVENGLLDAKMIARNIVFLLRDSRD